MVSAVLHKEDSWSHHKLTLPLGTTFALEYRSKGLISIKKQVLLTISPTENVFYALFEEDDVDFRLIIDNEKCVDRDVRLTLELQGKSYNFVLEAGLRGILETVKSHGGKFHFVKQSGEDGQALVAEAATNYGISFAEAQELVSRMKLTVAYSEIIEENITVHIRKWSIDISRGDTIAVLKSKIAKIEGIRPEQQRIAFGGKQLEDHMKLCTYNIRNGSVLHLVIRLKGGGGCATETLARETTNYASMEPTLPNLGENQKYGYNVGERGVICLGDPSSQQFGKTKFLEDDSIRVAPFVLEMRMGSRYKLV